MHKGITIKGADEAITLRIRVIPAKEYNEDLFQQDAISLYEFLIENLPVGTIEYLTELLENRTVK